MTSGSFRTIPLASIIIDRAERQRKDLTKIEELAASIAERGLIHPPVITRDLRLIAGERRVTAMRHLGWDSCPVQFVDDLPETELRAIELEENIKRVDISWQDQVRAIEAFHALKKEIDPEWNQAKTAEELGISSTHLTNQLAVARELRADPRIAAAPKYSVAHNIRVRKDARATDAAAGTLSKTLAEPAPDAPILVADFNEWVQSYDGPRFNFLHCDFPYGINAGEFDQGSAAAHGGYVDSPDTYFQLLRTLGECQDRILDPSAHVIFWFSMKYYHETLEWFQNETDFEVSPFPLIWFKSDNTGILPRPNHGPRQVYETAFFGFRGDRPVVRAKANAYAAPSVRDDHMSIKSESMLRHFFEMVVDENTSMLDPTCGSGGALRAADYLRARRVVGLERDPEFADRANAAFRKAKALRSAA